MKKVFISAFLLLSLLILNGCKSNQPPVKETGEPYEVNLACADFGSPSPGEYNKDYTHPTDQDLGYWQKRGLRLIRLPFKWERLQLDLKGLLNQHDFNKMKELVRAAEKRDVVVLPDLHNYCRRYMNNEHTLIGNNGLTIGDLAFFWQAIAREFSTSKNTYGYRLMNEPYDLTPETSWFNMTQTSINAVRGVDTNTLIMIGGNDWSSAERWVGQSDTLKYLKDPTNNLAFEVHVYFDKDASNTHKYSYEEEECYPEEGIGRVKPFVKWIKQNRFHGFIGEYETPDNSPRWNETLDLFLGYLQENGINGTYWAAGPWWDSYFMTITPENGKDRSQIPIIEKYTGIFKK